MGKEKFDRVFKHYDRFIDLFNFNKMEEIKDILQLEGNEVVLDIGGGTGRLADFISDDCRLVYVLDESKGMLSKIKPNPKVLPILGDALDTDFEDNSIDIVIMSDVIHHIREQAELINETYRILKDSGRIIILDFEKYNLRIRLLRAFEYLLFGKLYFKTSQEMRNLIKDKFSICKFIKKGYYYIIKGEKNV